MLIGLEAVAQLSLNAEFRPRTELRYGFRELRTQNQTPAFLISQRTRLSAIYQKEKIQFKLTLQEARLWGDNNNLSFYEAWAKYQLTKNWKVTIGRQELQYDGGRMIAARNRRQAGFNYDAIIANYDKDSLSVDVAFSVNNSQPNIFGNAFLNANSQFKNFSFLYAKKFFKNGLTTSGTVINSGFQKENSDTVFYKQTIGTKVNYVKNKFSIGGDAYYQIGKHKDGRTVRAYLVAAEIRYKTTPKTKLTFGVETTSGVDVTNTNSNYQSRLNNFDILEGARFAYWGNANIFRNLENHTAGGGLTDYYVRVRLKPNKKSSVMITYFQFFLTEDVLENSIPVNRNLGGELDILAKYKLRKETTISLGYSFIAPTNSLEFVRNVPANTSENGHYVWLMLTSKLKLL